MAKELPYFKFEPSEWINGNIQMAAPVDRAYFLELCCLYWSRLGDLPIELAIRKGCEGNANAFETLKTLGVFDVDNEQISIKFLDCQMSEFFEKSQKNSQIAKDRWAEVKRLKGLNDANALRTQSEGNANRIEEKRIEEKKEQLLTDFWNLYDKKDGLKKVRTKWMKLDIETMQLIIQKVPAYVLSTPDKKFRKNPLTYLNGEHWNDEIVIPKDSMVGANGEVKKRYRVSAGGDANYKFWTDDEHDAFQRERNKTGFYNIRLAEL